MSDRAERTDAELLRESDGASFAELYRRHVSTVYAWFQRRLEWAASDLTAETFAQAWLGRRRFRDQRDGSALPWWLGIARNVLRDSVRRDRIETRARAKLGLPLDLAADDGYARVEERLSPRAALTEAFNGLPDRLRGSQRAPRRRPVGRGASRGSAATEANLALVSVTAQHPDARREVGITVEGFGPDPRKEK